MTEVDRLSSLSLPLLQATLDGVAQQEGHISQLQRELRLTRKELELIEQERTREQAQKPVAGPLRPRCARFLQSHRACMIPFMRGSCEFSMLCILHVMQAPCTHAQV